LYKRELLGRRSVVKDECACGVGQQKTVKKPYRKFVFFSYDYKNSQLHMPYMRLYIVECYCFTTCSRRGGHLLVRIVAKKSFSDAALVYYASIVHNALQQVAPYLYTVLLCICICIYMVDIVIRYMIKKTRRRDVILNTPRVKPYARV